MSVNVSFLYTEHGETTQRRVMPIALYFTFGVEGEPPQWLLHAKDLDTGKIGFYAMKDIAGWEPCEALTAPAPAAIVTQLVPRHTHRKHQWSTFAGDAADDQCLNCKLYRRRVMRDSRTTRRQGKPARVPVIEYSRTCDLGSWSEERLPCTT